MRGKNKSKNISAKRHFFNNSKKKRDKNFLSSKDYVSKTDDDSNYEARDGPNTSLIVQHYELYEDPPPHKNKERIKFGKEYLLETSASLDDVDIVDEEQKQEGKRNVNLTAEQDLRIRQIYKERKQFLKNLPLVYVKEVGDEASLSVSSEVRYPLFYPDIEDLISFIQGKLRETRWIHIRKMGNLDNAIFISVEGLGLDDFSEECSSLASYCCQTEFVSPLTYDDSVESCIASKLDPTSINKPYLGFQSTVETRDGFVSGLDSLFNINFNKSSSVQQSSKEVDFFENSDVLERGKEVLNDDLTESEVLSQTSKSIKDSKSEAGDGFEKIDDTPEIKKSKLSENSLKEMTILDKHFEKVSRKFDLHTNILKRILKEKESCLDGDQVLPIAEYHKDNFSRLDLVMTPRDMANERYPLPFKGSRYAHFAKTKDEYAAVTDQSPMFGLDCEMCLTAAGNELTRISIVNEKHEVVYEKLVKPYNPIRNYLTQYSGITRQMLQDVTTRLPDVQQEIRRLLPPDAILVGQSLNGDLIAMKMMHPYVIDSSCIYNLTGFPKAKTKLKTLCAEFLSRAIQQENRLGHDSIEDSVATLELVQEKLKHSYIWGNVALGFKRSESESREAHIKLLENEKKPIDANDKARLAVNSKVDTPHHFAPPICKQKLLKKINKLEELMKDSESWKPVKRKSDQPEPTPLADHQEIEMPKSKKRKVDYGLVQERSNMESEQVNTHKETVGKRKSESVEEKEIKMDEITAGKKKVEMKNRDEAKDSGIEDSHSDSDKLTESDRLIALQNELDSQVNDSKTWAYDRVTIIGNDEVINKYKACLPEKNRERIDFVNVENNKAVVKKIILSDIQPNKQLIVAHLNTSNMKKVNKWSEEILSSIKSNDFLCMSLVGREKSNDKGALFATVPGSNNIPPVRQVIDQYLQSQGVIR